MTENSKNINNDPAKRRASDYWETQSLKEKLLNKKSLDIEMRNIIDTFLWDCKIIDEKNDTTIYEGTEDLGLEGTYTERKGFKKDYRKARDRYEYNDYAYHIDEYSEFECQKIIDYIKNSDRLKGIFRGKSIHKVKFNDDMLIPFSSSGDREKYYSDSDTLHLAVAKLLPKIWQSIDTSEKNRSMSHKGLSVKINFREHQVITLDFQINASQIVTENPEEVFEEFCPRICDFFNINKNIIISLNDKHIFIRNIDNTGKKQNISDNILLA